MANSDLVRGEISAVQVPTGRVTIAQLDRRSMQTKQA
jgi:hypothetical protein